MELEVGLKGSRPDGYEAAARAHVATVSDASSQFVHNVVSGRDIRAQ
ncbi:MAG: hypothetical protein KGQ46_14075 [Hyphomicrobiales bacterium]|nr:hypothetical protein [Hyphomicrobiales bacterium]MDE2114411.1 hypothetical protein [Hyphomicrobiales bacterium]